MPLFIQLLLLSFCFSHVTPALAVSQTGFPEIDASDFKHFIHNKNIDNNPYIYIYSSLSILKTPKEESAYSLTGKAVAHLSPVSKASVYPDILTQTRSEYFDFTIWGHLGNYFNQSAEIVELENEIVEIFETLESVNKKYRAIYPNSSTLSFNSQYAITADRNNFYSVRYESTTENRGTPPKGVLTTKKEDEKKSGTKTPKKIELLRFHSLRTPQVELNKAIVNKHSKNLRETIHLTENLITETSLKTQVQTLRQVDSGADTFMNKVIYFFTEAPGYIKDNPLESFIYLMFLYLFFKIAAMIFLKR